MAEENTGTTTPETPAAPTPPAYQAIWNERVGGFAAAIRKTQPEVETALKPIVGDPSQQALDALCSEQFVPQALLAAAFNGVPVGILNMNIGLLRGANPAQPIAPLGAPTPEATAQPVAPVITLLEDPPDEESFMRALQVGGRLKVDIKPVVSATKAVLALRAGYFDALERLRRGIEAQSQSIDEPYDMELMEMLADMNSRRHGDIYAMLKGTGVRRFLTQANKNRLVEMFTTLAIPRIQAFQTAGENYMRQWNEESMTNMTVMMPRMWMGAAGAAGMPPMNGAPPTDTIRDCAAGVNDVLNKVFAREGVWVAHAVAEDTLHIANFLNRADLPLRLGAANRDEMLKKLGIDVTADVVRLETNFAKYVQNLLKFAAGTTGAPDEALFIFQLVQLGRQVKWEALTGGKLRTLPAAAPARGNGRRTALLEVHTMTAGEAEEEDDEQ